MNDGSPAKITLSDNTITDFLKELQEQLGLTAEASDEGDGYALCVTNTAANESVSVTLPKDVEVRSAEILDFIRDLLAQIDSQ